jgi:hypothetical protein
VEGNEGVIGESAATVRGGGFVSIASNSLSYDYAPFSEAGDFGHGHSLFLASTSLIYRPILPPSGDSTQPYYPKGE